MTVAILVYGDRGVRFEGFELGLYLGFWLGLGFRGMVARVLVGMVKGV